MKLNKKVLKEMIQEEVLSSSIQSAYAAVQHASEILRSSPQQEDPEIEEALDAILEAEKLLKNVVIYGGE